MLYTTLALLRYTDKHGRHTSVPRPTTEMNLPKEEVSGVLWKARTVHFIVHVVM